MADPIWVTWMECLIRPDPHTALPDGCVLERITFTTQNYLSFYRQIGEPVNWDSRLEIPETELAEVLNSENNQCLVLRQNSETLGLCEFQMSLQGEAELQHFGLVPKHYGKGLGLLFLQSALHYMFDQGANRIWLHTDDWDSPAAQKVYAKAGFQIYDRQFVDPAPL
jgi:ribosomal protein S18 acetylase RimI-like enzyme